LERGLHFIRQARRYWWNNNYITLSSSNRLIFLEKYMTGIKSENYQVAVIRKTNQKVMLLAMTNKEIL
tara:strand:+ start:303 stop:506 length:204 start_codon:yes stop_codon:yes gene_type:complete